MWPGTNIADGTRFLKVRFNKQVQKYRVINIYAPNNENQRRRFFVSLEKWLCNDVIIVGDFNVALTKTDVSANNTYKNDHSRTKLIDIMNDYNFIDIWRVFNPGVRGFSRRQFYIYFKHLMAPLLHK
uniref:Endonuclease/exonuclease/phosphatase domain-containing protein n=1 Tax=Dicentrarchus labrax TaxID=13489 RepID=A0A8P4KGX1_DICLA